MVLLTPPDTILIDDFYLDLRGLSTGSQWGLEPGLYQSPFGMVGRLIETSGRCRPTGATGVTWWTPSKWHKSSASAASSLLQWRFSLSRGLSYCCLPPLLLCLYWDSEYSPSLATGSFYSPWTIIQLLSQWPQLQPFLQQRSENSLSSLVHPLLLPIRYPISLHTPNVLLLLACFKMWIHLFSPPPQPLLCLLKYL